jgi:polysaccharide biosynthesis transport protein
MSEAEWRTSPGSNLTGSVEDEPAAASAAVHSQRSHVTLRKYWWIPLITFVLGAAAAVIVILNQPPTFVSKASMWETLKIRLPEGSLFTEDVQNFLGTQTALLQSPRLRELALSRMRAAGTNVVIPLDKDREPLVVDLRVTQSAKSSVFLLEACSAEPAYTRDYLNALMEAYLEYKKDVRKMISGGTLASITEEVKKAERDVKDSQEILTAFQKTNNLAILEEEGKIAGGYLARLKTQLSDLQLEHRFLQAATADRSNPGDTNKFAFEVSTLTTLPGSTAGPGLQIQNREQLASTLWANAIKTENVLAQIKEWETKVVVANSEMAEAERLKVIVQRSQAIYDRLVVLVQNVGISRNIDQETLSVLEQASPAKRSYRTEMTIAGLGPFGGFALGVGMIAVAKVRGRRCAASAVQTLTDQAKYSNAAERLKQLKTLCEQSLLSKEAYDRKAAEIIESL